MKFFLNKFIILLCLIMISCNTTNPPIKPSEFNKGFDGVEFNFADYKPPNQLYEEDSVPLSILLSNKGATSIYKEKPVTITISLDNYYLALGNDQHIIYSNDLLGKSLDYPTGQYNEEINLGRLVAKELQGQIESPDTELFVNICYPYTTTFHTSVCMNSDLYYEDERRQICHTEEIRDTRGQGAPIAVTKIIPRITLIKDNFGQHSTSDVGVAYQIVKPIFEIYIENKNDGIPYRIGNKDVKDFCKLNKIDRKSEVNKVTVTAFLDRGVYSDGQLDCNIQTVGKMSTVLTLRDGKGIVYCTLPNSDTIIAEYNYLAQLDVIIDYVYSEGKTKNVEIVKKQFG